MVPRDRDPRSHPPSRRLRRGRRTGLRRREEIVAAFACLAEASAEAGGKTDPLPAAKVGMHGACRYEEKTSGALRNGPPAADSDPGCGGWNRTAPRLESDSSTPKEPLTRFVAAPSQSRSLPGARRRTFFARVATKVRRRAKAPWSAALRVPPFLRTPSLESSPPAWEYQRARLLRDLPGQRRCAIPVL